MPLHPLLCLKQRMSSGVGAAAGERVVYSLQGKGARVITGRNLDDDGTQSNASGKSSLVMAPLWALTGRSDARAEVSGAS